jgi:phosphatidylglycerophosphate synthase
MAAATSVMTKRVYAMIDGLFGRHTRGLWERLARVLVWMGCSPNAVTLAGLFLVIMSSLAYVWHGNSLVFGLCLAFALTTDGLDGAVARLTDRSSRFGGYLDAVVDRYQEVIILGTLAFVLDCWPQAFVAITGAMLTSYNKARTALEIEIDNNDWPDLLERLERMLFLIVLLLAEGFLAHLQWAIVPLGILVLGLLSHLTAVQRFLRARQRILAADQQDRD